MVAFLLFFPHAHEYIANRASKSTMIYITTGDALHCTDNHLEFGGGAGKHGDAI
jgi:hypothetical protein